jgi:hypothetical protein
MRSSPASDPQLPRTQPPLQRRALALAALGADERPFIRSPQQFEQNDATLRMIAIAASTIPSQADLPSALASGGHSMTEGDPNPGRWTCALTHLDIGRNDRNTPGLNTAHLRLFQRARRARKTRISGRVVGFTCVDLGEFQFGRRRRASFVSRQRFVMTSGRQSNSLHGRRLHGNRVLSRVSKPLHGEHYRTRIAECIGPTSTPRRLHFAPRSINLS